MTELLTQEQPEGVLASGKYEGCRLSEIPKSELSVSANGGTPEDRAAVRAFIIGEYHRRRDRRIAEWRRRQQAKRK